MGLRREKGVKSSSIRNSKESGAVYQAHSMPFQIEKIRQSGQEYEQTQSTLRVKHLTSELSKKTGDIERLRNYVNQLEEGEKGLIQELTKQLSMKDSEISRLAALYSRKEEENRNVSGAFESHIMSQKEHAQRIKDLLVKKEEEHATQIERLRKELERKDDQVKSLHAGLMENSQSSRLTIPDTGIYTRQINDLHGQIDGKETEIKKLERMLFDEQKSSKAIQAQMVGQISEMSRQTQQLKLFLVDKERVIKSLQSEFENAERPGSSNDKSSSQQAFQPQKMEELSNELEEREKHLKRIERAYADEHKLHKSVQSRLREQIATMSASMEELKSMLIEKEKLSQNLEGAFEKRLLAKEDEIRQMKSLTSKKQETGVHLQLDNLKSELRVKEETEKLMAQDIAKLTEQGAMLRKRLEERQRIYVESERAYEELIARLRTEHDSRITSLVQTAAQKEITLSAAMEEERSKLKQEKTLLREKEKQIGETLQTFATTSQQLIKLGSSGLTEESPEMFALKEQLDERQKQIEGRQRQLDDNQSQLDKHQRQIEERERYAAQKEDEIKQLLASTEQKIAELNEKQYSIETQEKLLLKEQEALMKELEVLSNAGLEISKSKQYLQERLEKVRSIGRATKLKVEAPAPAKALKEPTVTVFPTAPVESPQFKTETTVEEAPIELAEEPEPVISVPKATKQQSKQKLPLSPMPKLQPAVQASKGKPAQQLPSGDELFTELGGYSELDEIKSIVEVGLQHGDALEQIKESLISTGYSKQNVEKVLGTVKK